MSFLTQSLTRRELIAGLGVSALALHHRSPYGPFKMGVQSYSLRHFGLDEALDLTNQMGLQYWEAFPDHLPITEDPKQIALYKQKLSDHKIRLMAYGVVSFSNNEQDARRTFNFAKVMNIPVLSSYPSPDSFDLLDRLTAEYKILLAIHNHGPGDNLYDLPEKTIKAIQGHSVHIGECLDTGHMLRSDRDPVEAAAMFGKRLYDVHLKAVKIAPDGSRVFTEIGDPNSLLNTVAFLRLLRKLHYDRLIALEYEIHEENPVPYMKECLASVQKAISTIMAG